MKNKDDKKCKKGQETTIGKIIYGFLLFMPLFAIGVTCGYAVFNKNAYQSYSGDEYTTTQEITNLDELELNKKYHFDSTYNYTNSNNISSGYVGYDNIENFSSSNNSLKDYIEVSTYFVYYARLNFKQFYFYDQDYTFVGSTAITDNISQFDFELTSYTTNIQNIFNNLSIQDFENYSYIDNVFYYSIDKVTESPLFSWAQNSIVYTTLNNTCNTLSITTPFIPLLMSYWLIISVIYFLYDIALMLIWLIHNKIHELQESF